MRNIVKRLTAVFLMAAMSACAVSSGHVAPDRTGALAVDMLMEAPGNSITWYAVRPDGTISFAGGMDARRRSATWTGTLTDEQIAELRATIDAYDWLQTSPTSTHEPAGVMYQVRVESLHTSKRYRINGQTEATAALEDVLKRASAARLDDDLRSLPQPGLQR